MGAMRVALALVVSCALIALLACGHIVQRGSMPPAADGEWVVTAEQALADAAGGALLLDARAAESYAAGHVAGARRVDWLAFSAPGDSERGALHPDDTRHEATLAALGVRRDVAVRVVGDPIDGWGEDGRVVWTLRTLGHPDAALVDGGHAALVGAGAEVTTDDTPAPEMASGAAFDVMRDDTYGIETAALQRVVAEGGAVIVDAREAREYAGETPYGEQRGGHLPGAVHLHFAALVGPDGRLLPRERLLALLAERGITPDRPAVVYCTGGVRSGWFVVVLRALGWSDARNYAGSMWQWSAGPAEAFPLEID